MTEGQVLLLRATDAMAAIDLPHFCAGAGHEVVDVRRDGLVDLYLIKRGA
jgi:tRNA 2-thiouridine synthesizing protein A